MDKERKRITNALLRARTPFQLPSIEKFMSFVYGPISSSCCWIWSGATCYPTRTPSIRYGQVWCGNGTKRAHRISWILHNGSIPSGMCVLHKCDNSMCVNPNHLFLGTQLDNVLDMIVKGRGGGNKMRGVKNAQAILTEKQVLEIREDKELTYPELAKMYSVSRGCISNVKCRHSWAWL